MGGRERERIREKCGGESFQLLKIERAREMEKE